MKALQITLFLIANVIFLSQAGRNIHHVILGSQPSVLDKFEPEKQKARSEAQLRVLLADYQAVLEEIRALEKGKKSSEVADLRHTHSATYDRKDALRSEISQREDRTREIRDLWIYSGYGLLLIIAGGVLYRRDVVWPGFAILVSGFCILEYWASPSYFEGGANAEYHQLLLGKTILTLLALGALYGFWRLRGDPNPPLQTTATAPGK